MDLFSSLFENFKTLKVVILNVFFVNTCQWYLNIIRVDMLNDMVYNIKNLYICYKIIKCVVFFFIHFIIHHLIFNYKFNIEIF